jgi:hypothetical protein
MAGVLKWAIDHFLWDWLIQYLEVNWHLMNAPMIASATSYIPFLIAVLCILVYYHANRVDANGMKAPKRNVSTIEIQQPESSPQQIWSSPLKLEFGSGDKYERPEQILETGIFRRIIYVSVFNESVDDISDCNVRLIAATPRPKTGDNPTNFPVFFGANFDLRGKQRKFIQIARFAENHGNGSTLERDNIIISVASGGLLAGWTTIPIPSIDDPAILTLEAFAPSIASRTAHLHIWVTERRIHAKIA